MSQKNRKHDVTAVLIGIGLILLVGAYFIGKDILRSKSEKEQEINDLAKKEETKSKDQTATISPEVLRKKIQNGEKTYVVDIRPREAFDAEHIPNSVSLPGSSLENLAPGKNELVVIVFSEQDLAAYETARNILARKSFPYFFLEGGFEAWKQGGNRLLSAGDPNSFVDQSKVTFVSADELKKLFADRNTGLFVLDVRTPEAFRKIHLQGAVNIPLSELEKRAGEIPPARQTIVYGETELMSFQAAVRLFDLGIFSVKALKGSDNLTEGKTALFLEKS